MKQYGIGGFSLAEWLLLALALGALVFVSVLIRTAEERFLAGQSPSAGEGERRLNEEEVIVPVSETRDSIDFDEE